MAKGTLTVGDTILFLSLLSQLYAPLNYFGELRHKLLVVAQCDLLTAVHACIDHESDLSVSFAGTYYRNIQQSMLDMANMLTLLATSPQIQARLQDPSKCCTSPYAACNCSLRLHQHIVEHGTLPHSIISCVGAGRSGREAFGVIIRSH